MKKMKNVLSMVTKEYTIAQTHVATTSDAVRFEMDSHGVVSVILTNTQLPKHLNVFTIGYYLGLGRYDWRECQTNWGDIWEQLQPILPEVTQQLTPSEEYYVVRFMCDCKEIKRAIPLKELADNAEDGTWIYWLSDNRKYDWEITGHTDEDGLPTADFMYINYYEYDTDNLLDVARWGILRSLFVKWTLQNGEKCA